MLKTPLLLPTLALPLLMASACRSTDSVQRSPPTAAAPIAASLPATESATLGTPAAEEIDGIADVPAGPVRRVYSQVGAKSKSTPIDFIQIDSAEGRLAGTLQGRADLPVSQYMDVDSDRPNRPKLNWPRIRRAEAFFIEFDPPMEEWPRGADSRGPVEQQASLTACGPDGVPFTTGTVQRHVSQEGTETVETPAGTFPDCTRLRAETELRFGRWATIRVAETAWLSPHTGVVRRTEQLSGRAVVIFRFDSTFRYELSSIELPPSPARLASHTQEGDSPAELISSGGRWARLAIHIQRGRPGPRVAGLAVDWE